MTQTESNLATVDENDSIDTINTGLQEDAAAATKLAKISKEEKEAAAKAELQTLSPWKIEDYGYSHDRNVEAWMEDHGHYPTVYRAYTQEEWQRLITIVADTVSALPETKPDYQRHTGLYVEDQSPTYLLARGKRWQISIEIPSKKIGAGTKRIDVSTPPDRTNSYTSDSLIPVFVEFLTNRIPIEERDFVLDICSQYMKDVRFHLNKQFWGDNNPEIARALQAWK